MAIVEVQRDLDPLLAVWTHTLSQVFAHVESGISRYQQWLQLRWLVLDQISSKYELLFREIQICLSRFSIPMPRAYGARHGLSVQCQQWVR